MKKQTNKILEELKAIWIKENHADSKYSFEIFITEELNQRKFIKMLLKILVIISKIK